MAESQNTEPESTTTQNTTTAETTAESELSASETAIFDTTEPTSEEIPEDTTEDYTEPVDTEAPVIKGPANIYVARHSTIRYKSYVTVTDNFDGEPHIEVDNDDVNLSQEGAYMVVYTATDYSGNVSSKYVTVVVSAEEEPDVDDETIYAAADEILEDIITDDMSDLEKVFAVFYYVRNTFGYTPDNNYWDYKQEAYHMIMTHRDNCYANVCVSKLLLERLGFQSFMIQGYLGYVNQNHYWNMVSIDGGITWYHYDSAWWTWMHDEYPICMVTDEFAEEISERHGGLFNYDHDEYPSTPKEPLWTIDDFYANEKLQSR